MSDVTIRLSEIQKHLKAPKGQRNNFGNYKYRSLEDIMEAIKPLLKEDEFVALTDEIILVGDRYYVKATASFQKGSESILASAFAREPLDKKGMDSAQITGATSSYARKYACNGLFAIDDTKDADTQDNSESAESVKGINTGVRIPAGYWKMKENDPQGAQELLGENCYPGKTEKGYFIFTTEKSEEAGDFVKNLGQNAPKTVPYGLSSKEVNEGWNKSIKAIKTALGSFISHDFQLEIHRQAKLKGIKPETLKKALRDEFGVEGTAKITEDQYGKVIEWIISHESAEVGK